MPDGLLSGVMMSLSEQAFNLEQRLVINEMVAEYGQEKHITELGKLRDVVQDLAQAQVQIEKAVQDLGRQLGGLSENVGGSLEDLSYEVVPYVLEKELDPEVG